MTRLSIGEVRDRLADTINRVAYTRERVVVRRRGRDVAALVPVEDLELLECLQDAVDLKDARAALREARKKGSKPLSRFRAERGL